MSPITVRRASLGTPEKNAPQRRPGRSWPDHRGQALRPRVPGPLGRRGQLRSPWRRRLPAERTVSTLPLPLGTVRSSIQGHCTARRLPETPLGRLETASEPRQSLRCVDSGPKAPALRRGSIRLEPLHLHPSALRYPWPQPSLAKSSLATGAPLKTPGVWNRLRLRRLARVPRRKSTPGSNSWWSGRRGRAP